MRTANLCIICKGGRNLCGNSPCPLLPRFRVKPEIEKKVSKQFFGPSYNIFVGRTGYPNVSIGPLAAIEKRPDLDSPAGWFGMDYSKIIELRSLLLRSKEKENVFSKSKFAEDIQLLALSEKPADVEMLFRKKPVYNVSFSDIVQPMGPTALLERMKVTENVKVRQAVGKIVSDDLRAVETAYLLYKTGQDVYRITTILSSGILGLNEKKKLVPTRWSITATDDLIAKQMLEKIRAYPSISNCRVFESSYLDNHFVALLLPGSWEFENFEAWAPGSTWARGLKQTEVVAEYEPFEGRTKYAELEGGGYYASRIACIEYLERVKRQARCIVFREIYEGYVVPLGVWVVRETARSAYKNKKEFSTQKEAMDYIKNRLRVPVGEYIKKSVILEQRRLGDFVFK